MEAPDLRRIALRRFGSGAAVLGALLFGPAGTLRWWEAWLFLATLFVPMGVVVRHLLRHDPALLERRMEHGEERARQKTIVRTTSVLWLLTFLIPGLDHRFGWSFVPAWLVLVANGLVLTGYMVFFLTVRENSFASRTIRVEEGQQVTSSGPYAIVRHPMYLGISLMMLAAPIALGSWWALVPALTTPPALMLRIIDEEKGLMAALPGYPEYAATVRWRLVPGVW